MVIIFQKGEEFWIETFEIQFTTAAGAGLETATVTLDRPGTYLAGGANLSLITGSLLNQYSSIALVNGTGGGALAPGLNITSITFQIHQLDATSRTLRIVGWAMLRKAQ